MLKGAPPRSGSVFERNKVFLTGMKGKQAPGPGEYTAPSDFGQYISDRVLEF